MKAKTQALSLLKDCLSAQGYETTDSLIYNARLINELLRVAINNHLIREVVDNINTSCSHKHFGLTSNLS
jgi:hypothetical protein